MSNSPNTLEEFITPNPSIVITVHSCILILLVLLMMVESCQLFL